MRRDKCTSFIYRTVEAWLQRVHSIKDLAKDAGSWRARLSSDPDIMKVRARGGSATGLQLGLCCNPHVCSEIVSGETLMGCP